MPSLVTVSPVITAFHSCCLSHLKMIRNKDNYKFSTDLTMEDQIRRTNDGIYKTKNSNLDRPSGPMAQ